MLAKGTAAVVVLLLGVGALAYWYTPESGENEIHSLPNGYTGPVFIILGAEDGSPPEYEDGARLYRIPQNGILKTQFSPIEDYRDISFYYRKENGERRKIPSGFADSNISSDSVQVLTMQSGWIGQGKTSFIRYIVGREENKEELYNQMYSVDVETL